MSNALVQHTPAKPEKMNRKGFIGGSDIAAILGISPWKTAYELWEEKTTDWQEASSEQREKVLLRGKKLEPIEKWAFYDAVITDDHILTIQTADQQRYANILLSIGVRMD